MAKGKVRVTVCVSRDVLRVVDELAAGSGQSRSRVVEDLLREGAVGEVQSLRALRDPVIGAALAGLFGKREFLEHVARVMGKGMSVADRRAWAERARQVVVGIGRGQRG